MTEETALGAWYRLVEEIGHGAAGVVWRAVDTRTDQTVAAKLLRPEHASDPRLVERFVRERSLLMSLRDDAVVAVRDLVVEGDRLAIISDYMPEGSLRSRLEESGPFSPRLAARVTAVVLDGVDAARAAGIVHRDLKPDNVLLAPGWQEAEPGSVRVTDFGISRLMTDTRRSTTGLVGTPEYMPPELLIAGEAGFPADVYAAGILLYELLAGRTPFAGPGTDYTVAHRHVAGPPPPLPVPEELWTLVSDMLAKAPEARPTAAEAAASLRRMAPGLDDDGPIETSAVAPLRDADHPPTVLGGIDGHPSGKTGTRYRPARRSTGPEGAGGARASSGSGGSGVSGSEEAVAPVLDLGEPAGQTVLRPIRVPRPDREPAGSRMATGPWWRNRRVLVPVAAGLVIVVIAVVVLAVHGLGGRPSIGSRIPSPAATQQVSATQQDDPLPTGLGISRRASYDPQTRRISLTLTYSAEKAPLAGPMLEVLPGAKTSAECPAVVWAGAEVSENLPTTTGIDAACGWAVQVKVPAQQRVDVTAQISLGLGAQDTQQALQSWLDAAAAATAKAVGDSQVSATSYPVQRLRSIEVVAPQKAVSQTTLPITLVPVWPSGRDAVNPLYRSPSTGNPSSLLTAVAGGEPGVRFSDGCSGALAVSEDGLTVTALSIAPSCTVNASVGNFTDLASSGFSIVSRGG